MKIWKLTVALVLLISTLNPAEARRHHHYHRAAVAHPSCNILWPCEGVGKFDLFKTPFVAPVKVTHSRKGRVREVTPHEIIRHVAGIVAPLAAKVAEIQGACGSHVISGLRHTFVAGTHRISLHASGKAVDLQGNPGCIYSHLSSWPGGYSTDYGSMHHVHLSYDAEGRREWGIHFTHHHGYRHRHHRHRR
jgi:hypothetical protein